MVKTALVTGVLLLACSSCDRRANDERAQLADKVAQLMGQVQQLQEDKARLEQQVAALAAKAAPPSTAPLQPEDPQLIAAQDAYVHGEYDKAKTIARKLITSSPSKAWRIIGASECFLKNLDGARDAYQHVGQQERQFLAYVCSRNNLKLD
jgi:outer membrane murein-binding lipoprotein Lpp